MNDLAMHSMPDSIIVLIWYALWALVLVMAIGVTRFRAVRKGAHPASFTAGERHGADAYWRLNRAHANVLENLPIFATIVLTGWVVGMETKTFNQLAVAVLVARIAQSVIHISSGRARAITGRFIAYLVQVICMIWMALLVLKQAGRPLNPGDFIRANTALLVPPLVPEVKLHLATEVVPLWKKTEEELEAEGVPPPFWAFAWAGGQALARYVLDHRELVAGKNVLDFGAGSGLVGIAASLAGAGAVLCADTDIFAAAAVRLNGEANHARIEATTDDVIGRADPWNVILVGDMCYERPLADRLLEWLRARHKAGVKILVGDPGRSYFPKTGMERLALYNVQTTRELEDREIRETGVYGFSLA